MHSREKIQSVIDGLNNELKEKHQHIHLENRIKFTTEKSKKNNSAFKDIEEKKEQQKIRCQIHIGVPKTGTSSIQSYMATIRNALADRAILYPKTLGHSNHVNSVIAFQRPDKVDARRKEEGVFGEKRIYEYRAELEASLKKEINDGAYNRMVVSSEHLVSKLDTKDELRDIYDFFHNFSDDITIYLYLRRQDEFYISLYSTTIKNGTSSEKFMFPKENEMRIDSKYETVIAMWSEIFGQQNIKIRLYDKSRLKGGDIVADFCDFLELPHLEHKIIRDENSSLDVKKLDFLRRFNAWIPRYTDGELNLYRSNIVKALESQSKMGGKLRIDTDACHKFYKQFEQSNDKIAKQYFQQDILFDFSSSNRKNETPENQEITSDEAVEIAAKLWIFKEKELMSLRNNTIKKTNKKDSDYEALLHELCSVSFLKHPLKKVRLYKRLLQFFHQNKK